MTNSNITVSKSECLPLEVSISTSMTGSSPSSPSFKSLRWGGCGVLGAVAVERVTLSGNKISS